MASNREIFENQELTDLAGVVIAENVMQRLAIVKIKYMFVAPNISDKVLGRCIKCSKELSKFADCHYIIEVSKDYWDKATNEQRKTLLYHELRHIKLTENQKDGSITLGLNSHTVMDFQDILEEHGIDWAERKTTKAVVTEVIKEESQEVTNAG